MKSKRKPDLLIVLVLFVLIGVIASMLSQEKRQPNTLQDPDANVPAKTQNQDSNKLYRGNFLKVSSQKR